MSKKESDKSTALKLGLFMAGSVFGAVLYIFFAIPASWLFGLLGVVGWVATVGLKLHVGIEC